MKTQLNKSMLMLCLTILCAVSSIAQFNPGTIPSNRATTLLGQRFRDIHPTTGDAEVIFGALDFDGRGSNEDYDFDNKPEIRFTITYNPRRDEFISEIVTYNNNRREDDEDDEIDNVRRFIGNRKAADLPNMNFLQLDMGLHNNSNNTGSLILDQMEVNGQAILETYTVTGRNSRTAYLLDANLANGFTFTGRIRMTGSYNNSRQNNYIQFTTGYYYDFGTLPLEFTSIKGFAENGQNRINFTTADNHEAKIFYVERSKDGKEYENIGQVAIVNGRTGQYSFIDKSPLANGFYRIRGVNILDRMVYSDIIRINQKFSSSLRVINQAGSTELIFSNSEERTVRIYTFSGQLVKQFNFNSNRHHFQHQGLQKGMYVMQVNGEAIKLMVL